MPAVVQLETLRLILRPVVPEDLADIFAYSSEPEVGPNAGWKPHETEAETWEIMQQIFLDQEDVFAVVLKEEGRLIGTAGLIPDSRRSNPQYRMLGYAIGKCYWGRGLMTEAAKALVAYGLSKPGIRYISAYCYPDNQRSQRVLEKCGFRYEGRLYQSELLYNGRVLDELCFSMGREDLAAAD